MTGPAGRDEAWLRHEAPGAQARSEAAEGDWLAAEPVRERRTDHGEATRASRRAARRAGRHRDEPDASAGQVVGAALKEFVIVVGMALVLSFVVKTWLLQAFYIPSGSMEDTLRINDRVIVSKLTPGPVDLKRGDIIVFGDPGDWVDSPPVQEHGTASTAIRDALTFIGLLPDNAENHLIKRVIGLPGDTVACCDQGGRLTVNGTPIKEPYLKPGVSPSEQTFHITVPAGRVWVMGDNRPGSADSRAHDGPADDGSAGSVDLRLVVGRAVVLVWPLDHLAWLSNPSSTFADVPAAPPSEVSTDDPQGATDGTRSGGSEVSGDDGPTATGGG
jgi:signal peptidase I